MRATIAERGIRKACRVAVSSNGDSIDSEVVPIGQSTHFIVFEGGPDNYSPIDNVARGKGSEAGIKAAGYLHSKGVNIVITGNLGEKGFKAFESAGVKVHAGCSGKVGDSIQKCLKGELPECKGATYAGYIGF